MTICIIPARSGSKRIKDKNIKLFNGKPIISYAIQLAKSCGLFKRIVVSTDSYKISKIAKKYGAEVPFLRPKKLAMDTSRDFGFFKHLLYWLKKNENYKPDLIVQLRPTNPIRSQKMITKAIKLMKKNVKADSLRSISIPERSPYKMWIKKGKYLKYFMKDKIKGKDYYNMDRRTEKEIR